MTKTIIEALLVALVGGAIGAAIGTDAWKQLTPAVDTLGKRLKPLFAVPGLAPMLAGAVIIVMLWFGIAVSDKASVNQLFNLPGASFMFWSEWWFGTMLLAGGFAYWWVQTRKRVRGQQES